MTVKIGSNILSLGVQKHLRKHSEQRSELLERLSSGLRIQSASDDPAGLAVAASLASQATLSKVATRNLNDAISMLNIAEQGLQALTDIATRIAELAEQAANATYTQSQRNALDAEATALAEEGNRIISVTKFNGRNLLDGTLGEISFQAGITGSSRDQISVAFEDAYFANSNTGTFTVSSTISGLSGPDRPELADLNNDGILDVIIANTSSNRLSVALGVGDGTFKTAQSYVVGTVPQGIHASDVNGDGYVDLVSAAGAGGATLDVILGNGDGTFKVRTSYVLTNDLTFLDMQDVNEDGVLDAITVSSTAALVSLGNSNGSFSLYTTFTTSTTYNHSAIGADLGNGNISLISADGSYFVGNGNGTFQARRTIGGLGSAYGTNVIAGDFNGDGNIDLVFSGGSQVGASPNVAISLGNGNGTFKSATQYVVGGLPWILQSADLDGDDDLDLLVPMGTSGNFKILTGNGDGSFTSGTTYTYAGQTVDSALGDLNEDGATDFVVANATAGTLAVYLGESQSTGFLDPDLSTTTLARTTLTNAQNALTELLEQQGAIGAYRSRIESALAVNEAAALNYSAAHAKIVDLDVAEATSNLLRSQIMEQAAVALLAQANQQPTTALALIEQL